MSLPRDWALHQLEVFLARCRVCAWLTEERGSVLATQRGVPVRGVRSRCMEI